MRWDETSNHLHRTAQRLNIRGAVMDFTVPYGRGKRLQPIYLIHMRDDPDSFPHTSASAVFGATLPGTRHSLQISTPLIACDAY